MAASKPITCKAAVVWSFDSPIAVETVEVQPPGKGEVRVKMVAVGLCHSDLHALEGALSDVLLPYVPGHEGAGIVESVGEGVCSVKSGDKILTLCIPNCGKCISCKDGRTNICFDEGRINPCGLMGRSLGFDGKHKFTCNGKSLYMFASCSSFSEYTVIPESSCVKVDSKTNLEKACVFACAYPTGYGASTNSVKMRPDDVAGVWGLGGTGLPAVAGCKDQGVKKIIGINYSDRKKDIAKTFGCTDYVAIKDLKESLPQVLKNLSGNGMGLDFAIVCVGDIKSMEDAVSSTKPGGTTVLVGLGDNKDVIKLSPIDMLSRKMSGSMIGDYKVRQDLPKLVDRYNKGKLLADDLITGNFKLEQINDVIADMKQGRGIRSVILMGK
ncbi:NAD/NADP dependent alcohol dehydrogenase [Chamberlinius hualienensis]